MPDRLDDEAVAELRRSKKVIGELTPVVQDQHGRIISGRHRAKAGWSKVVRLFVKDDAQFFRYRLHYNVGRKVSYEEWVEIFRSYAEALRKQGISNSEIVKTLLAESPFEKAYTYEFIPDSFKEDTGRPKGAQSFHTVETSIQGVQNIDGTIVRAKESTQQPAMESSAVDGFDRVCPHCNGELLVLRGSYVVLKHVG